MLGHFATYNLLHGRTRRSASYMAYWLLNIWYMLVHVTSTFDARNITDCVARFGAFSREQVLWLGAAINGMPGLWWHRHRCLA